MSKGWPDFVVVDAFSGPGGLSLGFEQAGFRIGLGIERDQNAARTFGENFPKAAVIQADIEDVTAEDVLSVRIDSESKPKLVLIGGPPCQPFSSANMHLKNRGDEHPLASSVDHFARLLSELKPEAFLFENVTAFANMDSGKSMNALMGSTTGMGYRISVSRLDAQNFGVPQHRRRLFLGGVNSNNVFDLPPTQPSSRMDSAPDSFSLNRVNVRDAISDLPTLPAGGGGEDVMEYSRTNSKDIQSYQKTSRRRSPKLYNHRSSRHSVDVLETINHIKPGLSLLLSWKNLPMRIRERYGNKKSIQANTYRRLTWEGISPTIVHPRRAMLLHPDQERIISVREAARIQGFPDRFKFEGMLDSQYQQVANAVPPPLARFIALSYRRSLESSRPTRFRAHNRPRKQASHTVSFNA